MRRRLPRPGGRTKLPLRGAGSLALLLAGALASGCGMYGDLMLEERPVRTPEITEVEPISVPPGGAPGVPAPPADQPSDEDEANKKNEDGPAGGS